MTELYIAATKVEDWGSYNLRKRFIRHLPTAYAEQGAILSGEWDEWV